MSAPIGVSNVQMSAVERLLLEEKLSPQVTDEVSESKSLFSTSSDLALLGHLLLEEKAKSAFIKKIVTRLKE